MSFIEVTSHLAQISHNARHNIDREEEELTLGKTNNFLKNNASLLHHIFEDKEDDSPEEKDQFSIKFSEQERSPIKRKSIKYHSHIENIEDPKESKISKQKSGSATIPGIVHILPPGNSYFFIEIFNILQNPF